MNLMHSTTLTRYTNPFSEVMKEKEVVQLDDVNVPETGPEHRRLEERVSTMVATRANDETDGLTTQSPLCHLPLTMLTTESTMKL